MVTYVPISIPVSSPLVACVYMCLCVCVLSAHQSTDSFGKPVLITVWHVVKDCAYES